MNAKLVFQDFYPFTLISKILKCTIPSGSNHRKIVLQPLCTKLDNFNHLLMDKGWQREGSRLGSRWCYRCGAGDEGCISSQATHTFFFKVKLVPNVLMLRL